MSLPQPYTLLAIDNKETVLAGDTLVAGAAAPGSTAPGLLENDYLIFSDGSVGSAGYPTVAVYDVRIDGITYLVQTFVSDRYGDWSFYTDGVYHFIANGIDTKKLADGEMATVVLPYTVTAQNGTTDGADLIIQVVGRYDPVEASLATPLLSRQISESQWLDQNDYDILTGLGRRWFGADIRVDFHDNHAPVAVDGFEVEFSASSGAGLISDASLLEALRQKIVFGVDPGPVADTYRPYFRVNTPDISFLNETESLEVAARFRVSDGRSEVWLEVGSLTLFGENNAPFAHADAVDLPAGQLVASDDIAGVLANDFDADSQHQLYVTGAGYGGDFSDIDPGTPAGPVVMHGGFTTLYLFRDGAYLVQDNGRYFDGRTPWSSFTETYSYRIRDDRGAPGQTEGALNVSVLPSTDSRVVQTLFNSVYEVFEDDAEPMPLMDSWKAISVPFELISVFSKLNDLSDLQLQLFSVSDSNPLHAGQTLDPLQRSLLGAAVSIAPVLSLQPIPDDLLGSIWRADLDARFQLVSSADPYHASMLGFGLDMLNQGERVELTYSLIAGASLLDEQFIKVVIVGANDDPLLVDLSDQLFAGQAIARDATLGLLSDAFDIDTGDQIRLIEISAASVGPDAPGNQRADVSPGSDAVVVGLYGTLTVHADGSYSYAADQAAAQGIPTGLPSFDVFNYQVNDLHGGVSTAQLRIRVFGPQDLPLPRPDQFTVWLASQSPADPIGNVLDNDSPQSPVPPQIHWDLDGVTGILADASGRLYVDPDSFASLGQGESRDILLSYTISNASGASSPTDVLIHLVGSNDAPLASPDYYVYENKPGSVFEVAASDGLIAHRDPGDPEAAADSDADGDALSLSAIYADEVGDPISFVNGQATLLKAGVTIVVRPDGQFTVDAPDGYTGVVTFAYDVTDGLETGSATVEVEIGGHATLAGELIINEISLATGSVLRIVRTDNGAAPDSIRVGAASIELFNNSNGAITAAELASVTLQIKGADGTMTEIGLDQLTGLTVDKNGAALNTLVIPTHGMLMLYEPGTSGFGTWALYGPGGAFKSSGSYQGSAWELGTDLSDPLAMNLAQNGSSIDFFAANGADTDDFSGVIDIHHSAATGVPWTGSDISPTMQTTQFNAELASAQETVFSRIDFVDSHNASDWATTTRAALTIGYVNLKGSATSPAFIPNPLDPFDNLNQMQGLPATEGQLAVASSDGADEGGDSADIMSGSSQGDTLEGMGHNDHLEGHDGNDHLLGGAGGDILLGGAGSDRLNGGTGLDRLSGGDGSDHFVFTSVRESNGTLADVIADFRHGEDKIDLSLIDANLRIAGNQAFIWGGASLQTRANSVTWREEGGKTIVTADVTGDTGADLRIVLESVGLQLQATDFIL